MTANVQLGHNPKHEFQENYITRWPWNNRVVETASETIGKVTPAKELANITHLISYKNFGSLLVLVVDTSI